MPTGTAQLLHRRSRPRDHYGDSVLSAADEPGSAMFHCRRKERPNALHPFADPLLADRVLGHCMTFRDFNGKAWMTFHRPNRFPDERAMMLALEEEVLIPAGSSRG